MPIDIWRKLKTYLVHKITTQGKHLKKEKNIMKFNNILRKVPRIKPPNSGPHIVFNSATTSFRIAKYIYHIQAFKPVDDAAAPYRDGKITVIVKCKYINDPSQGLSHGQDYNKHFVSCAVPFRQTSS